MNNDRISIVKNWNNGTMLRSTPIKVKAYSGYAADEYPESFMLDNREIEISEITDRWYQGDLNPEYPVSNYFKVLTSDCKQYILKHELKNDKWFLSG